MDPGKVRVCFDNIVMVRRGMGVGVAAEKKIARVLKQKTFTIAVDLGVGQAHAHMWTTDLSYDYIRINSRYRS
jgi:glutamate N-acetyltransferase/amino-acid N-acetyltransferase